MRTTLRLVLAAALLAPALALAQVSAQFRLDLPVVLPQLVVVAPGVQVVPECEHEVFFSNGWYWVRQDGGWYRSHSHRGGWRFVQPERVPRRLVGLPPGQYRHWRRPPPPPRPAPARWAAPPTAPRPAPIRWGGEGQSVRGQVDRGGPDRDHGHGRGDGDGHGDRKRHGDRD